MKSDSDQEIRAKRALAKLLRELKSALNKAFEPYEKARKKSR